MFITNLRTVGLRIAALFLAIASIVQAADFTATYDFAAVTTASGTTDPTAVPVVPNLTLGSFTAVGTSVNPNAGGRFSFTNWPLGGVNANDTYSAHTGVINTGEYYSVTLTPQAGYALNLTALTFTVQRSGTGIRTYAVRSDAGADAYATNLPASINPANANLSVQAGNVFYWALDANTSALNGSTVTLTGATFQNVTTPVTFHFYGWNAEGTGGTFSIDNVVFTGSVVSAGGPVAPSITTPPLGQTVTEGATVQFTVVAGGTAPLNYQWRKGTTALNNVGIVTGATTDTLTLTGVAVGDAGNYNVVVTNAGGSATSADAALTVNPVLVAPSITLQPTPQSVVPGGTATFTVAATGTAPLSYQWLKGGLNLTNGGNVSGATTATLTLTSVSAADVASYSVVVSNGVNPAATSNSVALTLSAVVTPAGQVSYAGGAYTQNFDTLPSTGTFTLTGNGPYALNGAPVLAGGLGGWSFAKYDGTGTIALFRVDAGTGTSGSVYSYGSASASDRALGALSSGSTIPRFGVALVNSTGLTVTEFTLSYTGEQWRRGGGVVNALTFEYGLGATDINNGTFVAANALDFTAPVTVGSATALDGNAAANRAAVSATVSGLNWAPGQTLVLRWTDVNDSGSDDGLAIDDLTISTPVTPADIIPAVSFVTPADGTVNVAVNSAVSVTFNEAVNVSGTWFALTGSASGVHTATVTGGATSYTLTPDTAFAEGETVTLSVLAAQITDQATGTRHPSANYASSFITFSSAPIAIHTVQGSGLASPFATNSVTVQGVVVASFQGAGQIGGYYIEEPDALQDANPATSEGIYVFDNTNVVSVGDLVTVTGTVTEYGTAPTTETEISAPTSFTLNSSGNPLPTAAAVSLPFPATGYAERYEGMLVTFAQALTVTDNYDYGHFGEFILSNGRLSTPTNVVAPGAPAQALEAANLLNQIILDDGSSTSYPDPTPYLSSADPLTATRRAGSITTGVTGILDNRFGTYVIEPTATPTFVEANPRGPAPAIGGRLHVAIGNVLNFFNGDGAGGGYPTSRGATTYAEYQRQRAKIVAGITAIAPDIMGLTEVENDGFGPLSAIADLVNGLNAAAPAGTTYAFVDGSAVEITTDVIHVAFIYRTETVEMVGAPAMLNSAAFNNLARNPLAQTFREKSTGEKLTVCINHFRAKGSVAAGAGNPDSGDGQGNNNALRTQEAAAVTAWLATDPTASGDADFLIIGDLNAYAKEDPIVAIESAGFINLTEAFEGVGGYSYSFNGEFGHLDHALANPALAGQVVGAATWHVNSDEPIYYDFNTEDKTAAQLLINAGTPYRYSDHDPVVIGVDLTSLPLITTQPVAQTTTVGIGVTFTAAASGTPTPTYQWRKDGTPISGATGASLTISSPVVADAGSYDVVATNSVGSATSDAALLTVNKANPAITWNAPVAIVYGTPLSAAQLNATASVAGSFVYTPAAGTVLNAGAGQTLGVIFTPADAANYNGASAATTITVTAAPATVSLGNLAQVYDGTPKSVSVVVSPVGVVFQVSYSSGTPPTNVGSYAVSATVTDPNYTGGASGTLVIGKATPAITWPSPATIVYGTPLSATQLNATANTAGTFVYTPAAGTVLTAGANQPLGVAFTPADTANYTTASAATTITVTSASATVTLTNLVQRYDGTPRSVTATTVPAGLAVDITYNGTTAAPVYPGTYAVVATITDPNYTGSASDTLVVTTTALVRHGPTLSGGIDGSMQVLLPEATTLNSSAWISSDLLVPGTPKITLSSRSVYGGTIDASGVATPSNYTVTLNGGAALRHLVRRVDAITMATVAAPPLPTGTRSVTLNSSSQSPGDFATLRNLTLNSNVGAVTVPPGTYGALTVNGGSSLVFGVAGSTQPLVYNLQNLTLNNNSRLVVVGPVIINLANGTSLSGQMGAPGHPEWLSLEIASGGLALNSNLTFDGFVTAPTGTITIGGNSTLTGNVASDRLIINTNGALVEPEF